MDQNETEVTNLNRTIPFSVKENKAKIWTINNMKFTVFAFQ